MVSWPHPLPGQPILYHSEEIKTKFYNLSVIILQLHNAVQFSSQSLAISQAGSWVWVQLSYKEKRNEIRTSGTLHGCHTRGGSTSKSIFLGLWITKTDLIVFYLHIKKNKIFRSHGWNSPQTSILNTSVLFHRDVCNPVLKTTSDVNWITCPGNIEICMIKKIFLIFTKSSFL